jgi:hypothetical protein
MQYLAKNQSTQRCQSLITQGSDHPPVLEPHMVLKVNNPDTVNDFGAISVGVLAWQPTKGSTRGR